MSLSPRRRWTKTEKWLLTTPVLVGVCFVPTLLGVVITRKNQSPEPSYFGIAGSTQGALLAASGVTDVAGKSKGALFFWDLKTRQEFSSPTSIRIVGGSSTDALSLSPDAKLMAYVVDGSQLRVADRKSGELLWEKIAYSSYNRSKTRFSPDGRRLLVTSVAKEGTTYTLMGASNARKISSWTAPNLEAYDANCEFSPDGQTVVSVGSPHYLPGEKAPAAMSVKPYGELHRCRDGKLLQELFITWPVAASFSPDGRRVVIVATPNYDPLHLTPDIATCFEVRTGRKIWSLQRQGAQDTRYFADLAFSPNGQSIALLNVSSPQIIFLRADDGRISSTFPLKKQPLASYSADSLFWPGANRLYVRNYNSISVCHLNPSA